jgi:tetratricopeptide (TPR) repeat protein
VPEDPLALRQLALVETSAGNRGAAMQAARRACELAPHDPRSWSDLGRVCALAGDLRDAVACFAEAVQIDRQHADGWHNLGMALRKLGRRAEACAALKQALTVDDRRADTYLVLGAMLIDAGQFDDALECFERAVRCDPRMPRARSRLAARLSSQRKVKRAERLFRQSVAMAPDHIEGWMGLARTLEDLGETDGARAAYRAMLQRRPDHALALSGVLALPAAPDDDQGTLQKRAATLLRADGTPDEAKALIGYGLAKHHDRRGDHAAAALAGRTANAARRRSAGALDRAALTLRVDRIIARYDAAFFAERRRFGVGTDQPVFIVGLPRSGTTLTEQIIAAHPRLHGAGELPDLARLAEATLPDGAAMWQAASLLTEAGSMAAAGLYLRALRDGAPKGRLRISDKSPLNLFQLAFAALLVPGARVIHCRRDARDNALSIWMENFNADQQYATDFDDLAFFRGECDRLMAHWRTALPLKMFDMPYERTVADLEGQARRLTAFLGAAWDERCLAFHEAGRAVQTPSRWQVRQPIYARSVGRWRNYAAHLPEMLAAFPRVEP